MLAESSNRAEKFAWGLSLLGFGYLFLRIGLGLFAA